MSYPISAAVAGSVPQTDEDKILARARNLFYVKREDIDAEELLNRLIDRDNPVVAAITLKGLIIIGFYKNNPEKLASAALLFQRAHDLGDLEATSYLANSYLLGQGVESDVAKAVELHGIAFDGGYIQSAWVLASIFYKESHLTQVIPVDLRDDNKAEYFYKMALDKGEFSGPDFFDYIKYLMEKKEYQRASTVLSQHMYRPELTDSERSKMATYSVTTLQQDVCENGHESLLLKIFNEAIRVRNSQAPVDVPTLSKDAIVKLEESLPAPAGPGQG